MGPGFSRLSVTGYRRLKALDIALRPLNVLIGANGVGKSSFLDVIDLLAGSAGGTLQATITDMGGMASLLTADGRTNAMTLALQMDQEGAAALDYQIRLSSETVGYVIAHEFLTQHRDPAALNPFKYIDAAGPRVRYHHAGHLVAPTWEYKTQETALSQVPNIYPEAERFRRLLADVSEVYHTLDVSNSGTNTDATDHFSGANPGHRWRGPGVLPLHHSRNRPRSVRGDRRRTARRIPDI